MANFSQINQKSLTFLQKHAIFKYHVAFFLNLSTQPFNPPAPHFATSFRWSSPYVEGFAGAWRSPVKIFGGIFFPKISTKALQEDSKMAGSFQKSYDSFSEGLAELMEVSSSVRQSLTHERGDGHPLDGNLFEGMQKGQSGWGVLAIAKLASNASHYLECELEVALYKGGRQRVAYTTAGGLGFGWTTYFDGPVCFFLRHPDGDGIHKDSTLRQAALTAGWKEVRF